MTYDEVLMRTDENNCRVHEMPFLSDAKGLCIDNNIFLNREIEGDTEKKCILAEELGHVMTTYGNILDRKNSYNQKQEMQARGFAYDLLIGLDGLVLAYQNHCTGIDEFVEFLDVTKSFFSDALEYYKAKYGTKVIYKGYSLHFVPFFTIEKNEVI